ncbi:hypothetical protein C4D60_Mb05t26260 [Musa balbisiana]|uniref:Alpha/beta hydrolase fold-3 domain-containing protein n=1 Tax=Musa balbisiana TaxID=52838 RepID=A0A4S8JZ11_MUSBA|nr:hypothetical protein C4D60_Mb05t26260 [Musa balbisiana]
MPSVQGRPPRPRHQPERASTSPTSPAAPGEDAPGPRLLPRRRFRRRNRRLPHVPQLPQLPRGCRRRSRRVRELPPPEDSLPATYGDSLAGLRWVASRPQDEDWLARYGDIGRVFLAGDSDGANIVHQVALQAAAGGGLGVAAEIRGLLLVHPFFLEPDRRDPKARGFMCPGTTGLEDPWINPQSEGAPSLAALPCRRVLVALTDDVCLLI